MKKSGDSMPPVHHSLNYIEFSVQDMERAKTFYSNAFSWEFTDYGPGYAGIKSLSDDGEVGGFSLVDEVKPGGPLVVLYSEKLDESFTQVQEAYGEITKEIFSFPGGKRFEFKDTEGNQLAVWSKL